MTSSATQLDRIVTLVAELTRAAGTQPDGVPLAELAARHRLTRDQLLADVATLTALGEDSESDWLLSLSVTQQGDRLRISSAGPYRRPIRFTPDELLAMQLGLVAEADGPTGDEPTALSSELAAILGAPRAEGEAYAFDGAYGPRDVVDVARRAVTDRAKLRLDYAGDGGAQPTERVVRPHQVVTAEGATYLVCWCELASDWRRFRADRVVEVASLDDRFDPHPDFQPLDETSSVFREPADGVDVVRVRFSPSVARWLTERHPDAETLPDGSAVIAYRVASADWLVRHVLQYGPEAEVLEPAGYRAAVRRAVA